MDERMGKIVPLANAANEVEPRAAEAASLLLSAAALVAVSAGIAYGDLAFSLLDRYGEMEKNKEGAV